MGGLGVAAFRGVPERRFVPPIVSMSRVRGQIRSYAPGSGLPNPYEPGPTPEGLCGEVVPNGILSLLSRRVADRASAASVRSVTLYAPGPRASGVMTLNRPGAKRLHTWAQPQGGNVNDVYRQSMPAGARVKTSS